MDEPRLVAFEGFVQERRFFGLEGVEVSNGMAAKTPIMDLACGLRAKNFVGDGQQVVQWQKQCLSQLDNDFLLSGCERGLQSLRGTGSVMKTVSSLPIVDCAFTHAEAQCKICSNFLASRHFRSDDGRKA